MGQNTVSLNPSEETVDGAFSHVGIGGTWKPDQCESQIEGNVLLVIKRGFLCWYGIFPIQYLTSVYKSAFSIF